ncbi:MAG TPA: hypothetical protein VIJ93_04585, partial [bacterium]
MKRLEPKMHAYGGEDHVEKKENTESVGNRKREGEVIEGVQHHVLEVGEKGLAAKKIGVPQWEMAMRQLVLQKGPPRPELGEQVVIE